MPLSPQAQQTFRNWVGEVQPAATASPHPGALQALVYALQGIDAMQSAAAFRRGGHEINPMMQPFSHGGAPTMMAGFALGDLLRNALLRHASQGTRNTADGAQALSNLAGILQTNNALHAHFMPALTGTATGHMTAGSRSFIGPQAP